MTKAIIVGPGDVHAYFAGYWRDYPTANPPLDWAEWDAQYPIETVGQMWEELNAGNLSDESEVVIFNEVLFNDNDTELETAIVTFAPEAAVMVVSYDPSTQESFRKRVEAVRQTIPGAPKVEWYFINTWENPIQDVADNYYRWVDAKRQAASEAPTANPEYNTPQAEEQPFIPTQGYPEGPQGLVIASTSSKGGSGKTTVALCTATMLYHSSRLAVEQGLAPRPLKICIVDMDTRDGQIGFLLSQMDPTALNLFIAPEKTNEVIEQNLIYDERLGIHALLAPKRVRSASILTPQFYRDIIAKLRTMFDVVVLDTSVNYTDDLLRDVVLPDADAVLFVTNLSIGSVYGMTRWMDEVVLSTDNEGYGIPKEKIGVVVNQSMPMVGIDQDVLSQAALGAALLVAIPLDSKSVLAASNFGGLSDIVLKHTEISPAYFQLVKKIWKYSPLVSPMDVLSGNERTQTKASKPNGPRQTPLTTVTGEANKATKKPRAGLSRMFAK